MGKVAPSEEGELSDLIPQGRKAPDKGRVRISFANLKGKQVPFRGPAEVSHQLLSKGLLQVFPSYFHGLPWTL